MMGRLGRAQVRDLERQGFCIAEDFVEPGHFLLRHISVAEPRRLQRASRGTAGTAAPGGEET